LRLQNRLIQEGHHRNHITPEAFGKGISRFDFNRLHIVTDSKKWDHYTKSDIFKLRELVANGPNPRAKWVDIDCSLNYMNSLIDGLAKYNPIVHCADSGTIPDSGGLSSDFMKAFDFIRSFDKIMIFNSTFSWWAALLSDASQIGVFAPWKTTKKRNKNLGLTSFPGWFSWGDKGDLYWK